MSEGGAAGSKVRLAKTTGCLMIFGAGSSLRWRGEEQPLQGSAAKISNPSEKQRTIRLREDIGGSAFYIAKKAVRELRVCGDA